MSDDPDDDGDDDGDNAVAEEMDMIQLPNSNAMQPAEAAVIMGERLCSVVVLGGSQQGGKTTLMSSIYERFQIEPFAGLRFGWSRTHKGFEEICHDGRDISERTTPATIRTSRQSGRQIYHLQLHDATETSHDILITDLSGEEFDSIREHNDGCTDLRILRRADHFALVIDGVRLASADDRYLAYEESSTILRTLVETKSLESRTHLNIVFSKWDFIVRDNDPTNTIQFVDFIQAQFESQYRDAFPSMSFHRTSARDPDGNHKPAHGTEKLIVAWQQFGHSCTTQAVERRDNIATLREIDRYGRVSSTL